MSYLGRGSNLTRKAQDKVSFLATAGQTVRTGLSYVPTHVDVTVNGITLTEITDYTATNGNSITFSVALALNDEVTIVSSKTFELANHYTISAANTLLAAKATIANFTSTGIDDNATSKAITIDASEDIEAGTYSVNGQTNGIKLNLSSNTGRINISSINSTSDMLNFNTTNGEVGSIQAVGSGTMYSTGGTGGGIKLGGTGAANTLTDYEEGVFIPVVRGSTNAGSFSASNAHIGRYTKIGDVCTLNFIIAGTLSNATGSYAQFNLPFTVKAGTQATGRFSYVDTPNLNHLDFSSYVNQGQTLGYFIIKTASANTPVYPAPSSFMPASMQIYGTVTYHVA